MTRPTDDTTQTDDLDAALRAWGAEQRQHATRHADPAVPRLLTGRRRSHTFGAVAASVVLVAALALGLSLGLHRSPTVEPGVASPTAATRPTATPSSSSDGTAATRAQVAGLARRLARRYGDPSATARAVFTTRTGIRPLLAEPPRVHGDYWVIELHGDLTCRECLGHLGTTDYAVVIVSADLRFVVAGVKDHYDLSKLGRVVTLIR